MDTDPERPSGGVRVGDSARDGVPAESRAALPWEAILGWARSEAAEAARRFGFRGADRDDLEQDICLRIVIHAERFREDPDRATLETWVRMHASYEALDALRRRKRALRQAPDAGTTAGEGLADAGAWSVEDEATFREMERAFRGCLERVAPGPRERFRRVQDARGRGEGLASVAGSLGIGLERLKEVLKAVRRTLLRCLQERGFLGGAPPGAAGRVGIR
jgi:DNA-directed RNA polymerase specialized sigma24 family protein